MAPGTDDTTPILGSGAALTPSEVQRRLGKEKWEVLRIEFEYESRSFLRHGHDINGADVFGHEKKPSKLLAYQHFCQIKRLEGVSMADAARMWKEQKREKV